MLLERRVPPGEATSARSRTARDGVRRRRRSARQRVYARLFLGDDGDGAECAVEDEQEDRDDRQHERAARLESGLHVAHVRLQIPEILSHVLDIADAEDGIVFCRGDGVIDFHGRHHRLRASSSVAAAVIIGDSERNRIIGIVAHQESDGGVVLNNAHDTIVRDNALAGD